MTIFTDQMLFVSKQLKQFTADINALKKQYEIDCSYYQGVHTFRLQDIFAAAQRKTPVLIVESTAGVPVIIDRNFNIELQTEILYNLQVRYAEQFEELYTAKSNLYNELGNEILK